MYLVVTSKRDLTSDFIILEMQKRGLPYLRMNTEDIPQATVRYILEESSWQFNLPDVFFESSQIRAAYFRRPGIPEPCSYVGANEWSYCANEWHATLQSFYWAIDGRWLNSPHVISIAENKIHQLNLAKNIGFLIPYTLFTNDPKAAKEFAYRTNAIGKPLRNAVITGNGPDRVIFTSRLVIDSDTEPEAISACPIILQQEILKKFDIRVTVVGNKVFAVTIDSQSDPLAEVDWRKTSKLDLAHTIYNLPDELINKCIVLTKSLGLRFGAIDLILDQDDRHWFLEINPNGQWAWIETRTGHSIAEAIVSELESIANE